MKQYIKIRIKEKDLIRLMKENPILNIKDKDILYFKNDCKEV